MDAAHWLWSLNGVLLVLTAVMARDVISTRGARARLERELMLRSFRSVIESRPSLQDLRSAWSSILDSTEGSASRGAEVVDLLAILESARDELVEHLRTTVESYVNSVNDAAALVDEGLVRPKDLVRLVPALHEALLMEIPLVRPVIWFESILRGRGRWGYRVLRLGVVLEELRAVSPRARIRGPYCVEIADKVFASSGACDGLTRALRVVRLAIKSPSIDVRSKLRQMQERVALVDRLRLAGTLGPADPAEVRPVEW